MGGPPYAGARRIEVEFVPQRFRSDEGGNGRGVDMRVFRGQRFLDSRRAEHIMLFLSGVSTLACHLIPLAQEKTGLQSLILRKQ